MSELIPYTFIHNLCYGVFIDSYYMTCVVPLPPWIFLSVHLNVFCYHDINDSCNTGPCPLTSSFEAFDCLNLGTVTLAST